MADVRIQLFGGEQDGYSKDIDLKTGSVPDFFYIWPANKNEEIRAATKGQRMILAHKLAILAYEFTEERFKQGVAGNRELCYKRCETADKKQPDPAV